MYLYGGNGTSGTTTVIAPRSDLWQLAVASNTWTRLVDNNAVATASSYGTIDVAAASNRPGARQGAATWTDGVTNTRLYMFGGLGYCSGGSLGYLNDLWCVF